MMAKSILKFSSWRSPNLFLSIPSFERININLSSGLENERTPFKKEITLLQPKHKKRKVSKGISFVDSTPLRVCHNRVDRGYISQALFQQLFHEGLVLITTIRKNMKNRLMLLEDKLMQRKRAIIETINDQLKNISQIEHTRHRSFANFIVNLLAGLIAYSLQEKKPSILLSQQQVQALALV
jgi:hypothetical protein